MLRESIDSKKAFIRNVVLNVIITQHCIHDETLKRVFNRLNINFLHGYYATIETFINEMRIALQSIGCDLENAEDDEGHQWWTINGPMEKSAIVKKEHSSFPVDGSVVRLVREIIRLSTVLGREITFDEIQKIAKAEIDQITNEQLIYHLNTLEESMWLTKTTDQLNSMTWKCGPKLFFGKLDEFPDTEQCELCQGIAVIKKLRCPYTRCHKLFHTRCIITALRSSRNVVCPFCRLPLRYNNDELLMDITER